MYIRRYMMAFAWTSPDYLDNLAWIINNYGNAVYYHGVICHTEAILCELVSMKICSV